MKFDLQSFKTYGRAKTRDGREAVFVAHIPERPAELRLLVVLEGEEKITGLHENGRFLSTTSHENDLVVVPFKTVWVNVYKNGSHIHSSKEEAEREAVKGLICCVEAKIPNSKEP